MRLIIAFLILPIIVLWGNDSIVVGKRIASDSFEPDTIRITMDLDVLKDSENRKNKKPVVIEMDDNKSLTFIPKRFNAGKKKGDFSWMGKSSDGKAKAILSVRNGVMFGTVTSKDGTYKIYPENGHFKVIKIDPSMAIPFDVDTVTEPEKKMLEPEELISAEEPVQESLADPLELQPSMDAVEASVASASDTIVTMLVYYTQALEDKYGVNTEAMIQANLDLAKDAYIDSDTQINLQIAIIKKVPAGSLLSSADSTDLYDLLNKLKNDGLVRYERQVYNADAVTVFSAYPGYNNCGLGTFPTSTTSNLLGAHSSVHIKPASEGGYYCSDLTFSHELGHNFGCAHDPEHSSSTPMYPYAYGYDIYNTFGTIMSYDGPEISFFSNPNIIDVSSSLPIGEAYTADNARAIRENQAKMADNSEQISEALESSDNDILNGYAISGYLNNFDDRDGYVMWLEGSTRFIVDNTTYSNNAFFLNLYNEETHAWIDTFNADDTTIILPKGRYRVTFSFTSDETGLSYSGLGSDYTTDITTEYVPPVFSPAMPAIINYLLN